MEQLSCFILDDEKRARERMAVLLQKYENVIISGIEGVPEEAIKSIVDKRPDLVFIDVEMPRYSGFDVIKEVRSKEVAPEFVFVTAYNQYAIRAIKNEAFDFLLKPVDIDELSETIERYAIKAKQKGKTMSDGKDLSKLFSGREKEIIKMIVDSKSASEIAEELHISKNTVDTHRKHILEKTGLHKISELIVFAIDNGLR